MEQSFINLGIRKEIADALRESGIHEPTPVQLQAIPTVIASRDVIAQAQTGTGKTLAFGLPILEIINPQKDEVQALILTPTRELAIQITAELKKWAQVAGANILAAYGGQDVERQLKKLKGSIHIVVATPGRLLDHLRRGAVNFGKLAVLVLDEADQMLQMGFLNEVEEIIAQTPSRRQTLLFSATMPSGIKNLAKRYMREPVTIQIHTKQVTVDKIEQWLVETSDRNKQDALVSMIEEQNPFLAMVFCRTKRRATTLNDALLEKGIASDELHGDLSQAKREQVMKRFREAKIQVLVATDIAARGLDVEGVSHVYNYDIPHDAESYIHRIGRTGRAGQTGVAVTLASPHDREFVQLIERGISMKLRKRSFGRRGGDEPGEAAAARGERAERGARRGEGRGASQRSAGARRSAGPGGGPRGAAGERAAAGGRRGQRSAAPRGERSGRGPGAAGGQAQRGGAPRGGGAGARGGGRSAGRGR